MEGRGRSSSLGELDSPRLATPRLATPRLATPRLDSPRAPRRQHSENDSDLEAFRPRSRTMPSSLPSHKKGPLRELKNNQAEQKHCLAELYKGSNNPPASPRRPLKPVTINKTPIEIQDDPLSPISEEDSPRPRSNTLSPTTLRKLRPRRSEAEPSVMTPVNKQSKRLSCSLEKLPSLRTGKGPQPLPSILKKPQVGAHSFAWSEHGGSDFLQPSSANCISITHTSPGIQNSMFDFPSPRRSLQDIHLEDTDSVCSDTAESRPCSRLSMNRSRSVSPRPGSGTISPASSVSTLTADKETLPEGSDALQLVLQEFESDMEKNKFAREKSFQNFMTNSVYSSSPESRGTSASSHLSDAYNQRTGRRHVQWLDSVSDTLVT